METLINKGQSLFEAVIAIAMVSIILIAIVSTAVISVKNSSFSRNKTLASKMGQDTIEWLRGQRDAGWVTFYSLISGAAGEGEISSNVWCMPTLDWLKIGPCSDTDKVEGTIFVRQLNFETLSPTEIQATITISWNDGQGYHEVKLITYFSDWRSGQ